MKPTSTYNSSNKLRDQLSRLSNPPNSCSKYRHNTGSESYSPRLCIRSENSMRLTCIKYSRSLPLTPDLARFRQVIVSISCNAHPLPCNAHTPVHHKPQVWPLIVASPVAGFEASSSELLLATPFTYPFTCPFDKPDFGLTCSVLIFPN